MISTFQFDTASLMLILPEIFLLSAIVVVLLLDLFLAIIFYCKLSRTIGTVMKVFRGSMDFRFFRCRFGNF